MDEYYYPNESLKTEHTNKIKAKQLGELKNNKLNTRVCWGGAVGFALTSIAYFFMVGFNGPFILLVMAAISCVFAAFAYLRKRPPLIQAIEDQRGIRTNEILILRDYCLEYQYTENHNSYILSIDYKNIDIFEYDWEYIEVYAQNAGDIVRQYKDANMFDYYVDHTFSSDSFAVPCYIIDNDEILDSIRKRKKMIWE